MGNIGSTNGNRMLNMATSNVDTLRAIGAVDSLITNLQTNNIDISRIQETHNSRNDRMGRGGIIQSPLAGKTPTMLKRHQINQ